jgi:hypothetical protein
MEHIKKFNEGKNDMVTISLPKNEYKLLILLLKDLEDRRGDDRCNDPYGNEKRLFSKSERIDINLALAKYNYMSKEDAEENEDFLYNTSYVAYLYNKLKRF